MAFYVRYFDAEALLQKEDEIVPFIASLNILTQREMDILGTYIGKLKNGTNRIYLDKKKNKYILAIGTDKTDIRDFQKNAKKEARPAPKSQNQVLEVAEEPLPAIDVNQKNEGWHLYSMDYDRFEEGTYLPYTFKAKIKDASLLEAYDQMASYLVEQHPDACQIADFFPELIQVSPVTE